MTLSDMLTFSTKSASCPHAVVIGSGFARLAAAIRLGARGYRVTLLERLDQLGGRARVHRQDGFTFMTAPFLFKEPPKPQTARTPRKTHPLRGRAGM